MQDIENNSSRYMPRDISSPYTPNAFYKPHHPNSYRYIILQAIAETVAKRRPHRPLHLDIMLDLDWSINSDGQRRRRSAEAFAPHCQGRFIDAVDDGIGEALDDDTRLQKG
jgi:hypothetical protein